MWSTEGRASAFYRRLPNGNDGPSAIRALPRHPDRPGQAAPPGLGAQPRFTSTVLSAGKQRALFRRWASDGTRPHERLTGLVALLHPASSTQIRNLTVGSVDQRNRALALLGRPLTVAADPTTWAAVQACLAHRDQLATLKPAPHRGRGAVEQPWGLDLLREAELDARLEAGEAGQPEFWVRTDVVP